MSHLVVCGINYHSTPIAIRERFTIPETCLGHALRGLAHLPHVKEAVVLSTCNRTEVYAVVSNVQAGWREIESFFASAQAITDHQALKPNFRLLREDVAVHLFRVASGLDSMVLGEGQIMAQVKGAYQAALGAGTAGPVLDHLFQLALNCGKRVRSETTMGKRAVSVSSAALELAKLEMGSLKNLNTVIIGAGKMAQICVKLLLSDDSSTGTVFLVNRSPERIEQFLQNNLSNRHRLDTSCAYEERHQIAAKADLVIVSTSAQDFVLTASDFRNHRDGVRAERTTCVIDISVPRNVDSDISTVPGVKHFHSDHLGAIVSANLAEREALVSDAQEIVFQTLEEFHSWQRSLLVVPTIAELREKIEAIRQEQMAKTRSSCSVSEGKESKQQVEDISRAIVNQILHHPTVQLKATRDYEILRQQAEALRTLFNLDPLAQKSQSPRTHRTRKTSVIDP